MDNKRKLVEALTSSTKYLPTWYNYDDIGSKMEEICTEHNKGYYLGRSQVAILQKHIQDIIVNVPYDLDLVDLGCGSCYKTRFVIDELLTRQDQVKFFPIDISKDFLMETVDKLTKEYGDTLVSTPIAKDYDKAIEELRQNRNPKIILWFGSIINLTYEDQVEKLKQIAAVLTDKCFLIFSVDITQNEGTILKAYHDDQGLESRFFQNSVERLNREEGTKIDLDRFDYKVEVLKDTTPDWMSYFVAYLQAKEPMDIAIPGLKINLHLEKDERIYLADGPNAGTSCKYTEEQICTLTRKAGLQLTDTWTDDKHHAMICRCRTARNVE